MLRLGIVDFDTSHAIEFTQRFNHVGVDGDQFVDGARVVLGCPGESRMAPERIAGFAERVRACGVELVGRPKDLLGHVDGVLILSLCGAAHLDRARPFLEAGVPTFVDKPFACAYADAAEMVRLADAGRAVLSSSSALPFSEDVVAFRDRQPGLGRIHGAFGFGPAHRAPGNPGLLHYAIHAVSIVFALMGPGCAEVVGVDGVTQLAQSVRADAERAAAAKTGAASGESADVVTGRWTDGRLATVRGSRSGSTAYGFVAFCERGVVHRPVSARYAYRNLCREIVASFESGRPVVPHDVTLEITRFLIAANASQSAGSASVKLSSIV